MTIDEAIAKYKEITNADANCPAHCNISCDKCVQESEQLAKWLEELKAYREIVTVEDHKNRIAQLVYTVVKKMIEAFENLEIEDVNMFQLGYNKAIDDFAEKLKENISESLIWGMIADCFKYKNMNDTSDKIVDYVIDTANEISEQLKAGDNNDQV